MASCVLLFVVTWCLVSGGRFQWGRVRFAWYGLPKWSDFSPQVEIAWAVSVEVDHVASHTRKSNTPRRAERFLCAWTNSAFEHFELKGKF